MFKQGTYLQAVESVTFKPLSGRKVEVLKGDQFMVTNTLYNQQQDQLVQIGRINKAKIGKGYFLSFDLISQYFKELVERVT